MKLNEISDRPGARQARKRVGRGIGSGLGKTAGRGQKGQKSRSGVAVHAFEGGQMPIHRRLPKRGFRNPGALRFAEVGLDRIQAAVDSGRLDASQPVTEAALEAAGLVTRLFDGVRVLGNGSLTAKLTIEVTGATRSAAAAIEAAGGTLTLGRPHIDRAKRPPKGQRGRKAAQAAAGTEASAAGAPGA